MATYSHAATSLASVFQGKHSAYIALACALIGSLPALAADVVIQPASGSGFVVKDASGANERLRVQESGAINLPSVVAAPAQTQSLCMSATGQLGPCSGGGGSSYTAATGLSLTGTTFSIAPTYQLPQTCNMEEIAQWNGTEWICGLAAIFPTGSTNDTLRYDANNNLIANYRLRAYADGGLTADGYEFPPYGNGIPKEHDGSRLMWYPGKSAFRVGFTQFGQWNDANIGGYSVAMGNQTMASGVASVATGQNTVASGDISTAMGSNVSTNGKKGSFIYGDASSTRAQGKSVNDNDFTVIATGGVQFFLSDDGTKKAYIAAGDSAWNVTSDRNAKTAIVPVDGREVLEKVVAMPLSTWRYKSQEATPRHMGPMAQDFHAAFGLGDSDKSISTVDADGVALAAIQGLHALLTEKDAEAAAQLDALRSEKDREMSALRADAAAQAKTKDAQIATLQARVASLESAAGDIAEMKAQLAALRRSAPDSIAVALRP